MKTKVTYPYLGHIEEIGIDFDELKRTQPTVKMNGVFLNLETQARHAVEMIESSKSKILASFSNLVSDFDSEIITSQLDAIVDYLNSQLYYINQSEGETSEIYETVNKISNDVYKFVEVAKCLLEMYSYDKIINKEIGNIEDTQKGILK